MYFIYWQTREKGIFVSNMPFPFSSIKWNVCEFTDNRNSFWEQKAGIKVSPKGLCLFKIGSCNLYLQNMISVLASKFKGAIRPGMCVKYFLSLYSCTKKKPFGTWQFGKIWVLVNFIIQKLKSKHLVCLIFPWFFWKTRENILHILRALK